MYVTLKMMQNYATCLSTCVSGSCSQARPFNIIHACIYSVLTVIQFAVCIISDKLLIRKD